MITIPNCIYQIGKYKSYEELEFPYNLNAESWKKINPDWQYLYTNDIDAEHEVKEFDKDLHELFIVLKQLEVKNNISGAYKTDIWRYIKLYENGGVYADLDSASVVSLSLINLIDYQSNTEFLIPPRSYGTYWSNDYNSSCKSCNEFWELIKNSHILKKEGFNNAMFAVTPRSKILLKTLEETIKFFKIFKKMHGNQDYIHWSITSLVDALFLNYMIQENIDYVSETFIYGMHAPHIEVNGSTIKNYKDDFVDFNVFTGSIKKYSDIS